MKRTLLKERLSVREKEIEKLKKDNEDLNFRFHTDLRKVRIKERELEARQEILKAESQSVLRLKDEMILDLKRQMDDANDELENFKTKFSEMNAKIHDHHDRGHRTVKALRLALGVLEQGR